MRAVSWRFTLAVLGYGLSCYGYGDTHLLLAAVGIFVFAVLVSTEHYYGRGR